MKRKLNCIMLVDDSEADNFLNQMYINDMDCCKSVLAMQSAKDALKFLEGETNGSSPDLILLDINMPGMNGWEFLEEYKKLKIARQKKIEVIVLSTSQNPRDRERAEMIQEISEFKAKPLSKTMLTDIFQTHFPNYM
ncbi:MAG: response regulator [Calditrichaeota bacterium]|nr:response regulator [Calditrichota bacterium]